MSQARLRGTTIQGLQGLGDFFASVVRVCFTVCADAFYAFYALGGLFSVIRRGPLHKVCRVADMRMSGSHHLHALTFTSDRRTHRDIQWADAHKVRVYALYA